MKIPFDIKFRPQIESGEYKVVTSFGEPAEIVKWDCKGQYPLLACIFDGHTDDAEFYTEEGKGVCSSKENYLFIITPESELSEFEKAVGNLLIIAEGRDHYEGQAEHIKKVAAELLTLARKEVVHNIADSGLDSLAHKIGYQKGFEAGKAEALKDLPRWKKLILKQSESFVGCRNEYELFHKGRVIALSELEKLPGFKED